MKAKYNTPKAEKLDFDYTESVVASNVGIGCQAMTYSWYAGQSEEPACKKFTQHNNGDM